MLNIPHHILQGELPSMSDSRNPGIVFSPAQQSIKNVYIFKNENKPPKP